MKQAGRVVAAMCVAVTACWIQPLASAEVIDETSPHDIRDLHFRLDLGGDTLILVGSQRYVTLYVSNPTDHNVYLFRTGSRTDNSGTLLDVAAVRSLRVQINNFLTREINVKPFPRMELTDSAWVLFGATLDPSVPSIDGPEEVFFIPAKDHERPLLGFLLDPADLPLGEYELFVLAQYPFFATTQEVTVAQGRFSTGEGGKTPQIQPETPWQTNAYGTEAVNVAWNYNMGYQFVPQVSGKVTKLGGFFNGTKGVRLYDSTGSTLALANVTASNSWAYTPINPVAVAAGQTYTVAVNLAGSGGSYRNLGSSPLPKTFGKIQILKSVYRSASDLVPTSGSTGIMYGQADIEFVPD